MSEALTASLSLMRRLPPQKVEQNLNGLLNLLPEETDELLQRVDQPLKELVDTSNGRSFLQCDYNRDGDSFRSPWSNRYYPALEDGFLPTERLRTMEIEANELFDAYRELYYEGGVSSVYLWDLEGQGFAGCFLIKKRVANSRDVKDGNWDSIHIVEVKEHGGNRATYKLTTTILLNMGVEKAEIGNATLSGSLTRQTEQSNKAYNSDTNSHISIIGRMIEDMETDTRSNLYQLYLLRTMDVVNNIRDTRPVNRASQGHVNNLNQAVLGHGKGRKVDTEATESV